MSPPQTTLLTLTYNYNSKYIHVGPSMYSSTAIPHHPILICDACSHSARICAALSLLSRSILICAAPWCLLMICDALLWSVPLCDTWHHSGPPVLFCASSCCSFQIYAALCHSAACPDPSWSVPLRDACWCSVTLCSDPSNYAIPGTAPVHPCCSAHLHVAPSISVLLCAAPLHTSCPDNTE